MVFLRGDPPPLYMETGGVNKDEAKCGPFQDESNVEIESVGEFRFIAILKVVRTRR